jgi:hypothetical protein
MVWRRTERAPHHCFRIIANPSTRLESKLTYDEKSFLLLSKPGDKPDFVGDLPIKPAEPY